MVCIIRIVQSFVLSCAIAMYEHAQVNPSPFNKGEYNYYLYMYVAAMNLRRLLTTGEMSSSE